MTAIDEGPECSLGEHGLCSGPAVVVRRRGAPAWEVPVMTIRCGCVCHRGARTARRSTDKD